MKKGFADITLIVDRSGSMLACRDDAEGGINQLIEEQAAAGGDAVLTLVQFDTEYEFIHKGMPIKCVPKYTLVPRGMTALLDAVGKAIAETGERLAALAEADRPDTVFCVIVTDGAENASREFTKQQVCDMIETQKTDYNWQFTFIGASPDTFAVAGSFGIAADQTLQYDPSKTGDAYRTISSAMSVSRGTGDMMSYTDEDRKAVQ